MMNSLRVVRAADNKMKVIIIETSIIVCSTITITSRWMSYYIKL